MIRAEYDAWELEVAIDNYRLNKDPKELRRCERLFENLMKVQSKDGAFHFSDKDKRIWTAEAGLAAWGFFKLYRITGEKRYLVQGDRALRYIARHPIVPKADEPRMYYLFIAWCNYAYLERAKISDAKKYLALANRNGKKLLDSQKLLGNWTIVLHYDLYVARNLVFMYNRTKNRRYLDAVLRFIRFASLHKTPLLRGYPIHYQPLGTWLEGISGYSTNQFAELYTYLYMTTKEEKYLRKAKNILSALGNIKSRRGKIYKTYRHKDENSLATMWLEHNKTLLGIAQSGKGFEF